MWLISVDFQKMVLSASGANAIGLGLGMSVGGMFPVLGGSMMPNLRSGGALAAAPETATKVICLSQVIIARYGPDFDIHFFNVSILNSSNFTCRLFPSLI